MKKLVLIGLMAIFYSISGNAQNKINEGFIVYAVEWKLPAEAPPQMAAMLPSEIRAYFKGDSSATNAKSPMSSSITIMNAKTQFMKLLLDIPMMDKKYSVQFTPADQEQMKDHWPDFSISSADGEKTIAGYKAARFVVKDNKSDQTFDAWFTRDLQIAPNSLTQFFTGSEGFPLEFITIQNGMGLKATVKEIKSEKVPAGIFSTPKDYQEISFEELKGMMASGRQ